MRLFQQIADSAEIAAIPDIIAFLLSDERKIAVAAAEAVHHLLTIASAEDLAWLDEQMRHRLVVGGSSAWYQLRPAQLDAFQGFRGCAVSLLGPASFHGCGYVREQAVELLAKIFDGSELPYLLIRTNDWVAQVRCAALEAIRARITPEYAGYFVNNLMLIERLQHSARYDHTEQVCRIFQLLQQPDTRSALYVGLQLTE